MIFEKIILKKYKGMFDKRCDGNPLAKYLTPEELGIKKLPLEVKGDKGILKGYFYYCTDEKRTDKLIIFDHGMGAGHNAYMREIATIAKKGYTVFAYDHTGCMESEGEGTVGFAQSLNDLDKVINAIKFTKEYSSSELCVVGHSWGAFAALNIPMLHPDLKTCVAISGFISVEQIINQFFDGILKGYRKTILKHEKELNPAYAAVDARESLLKTKTKMLIIHSTDDPTVKAEKHFELLRSALTSNDNVRYLRFENKKHNPNYTEDAVNYLGEFSSAAAKLAKKKPTEEQIKAFRDKWDFVRMTEQDEEVWKNIFRFIG